MSPPSVNQLNGNIENHNFETKPKVYLGKVSHKSHLLNRKQQKQIKFFTKEEVLKHDKEDDCWLIVNGSVYDVTRWLPKHPGGTTVILSVGGRDATDLMKQMHPVYVFKYLKSMKIGEIRDHESSNYVKACRQFQDEIEKEGFFETSYSWYIMKTSVSYLLLAVTIFLFIKGRTIQNAWIQMLGSIMYGIYLQQTAFLGHDAGHSCIFHNRFFDSMYGLMVGNLMTGISSAWWKDSHNVHHSVPNAYKSDPDIQHLPVFAVTSKYFNSIWSTYHKRVLTFNSIAKFLVAYQHVLFYPIMALARFNLYAQGYILVLMKNKAEWKKLEIAGIVGYWTWVSWMLSHCLTWPILIACLILSHAVAGLLHVQICLSHFSMEIFDEVTYKNDQEQYFDTQLRTCIDIDCPRWMDWFHGGLQFQTAHHIFPRVPRHRLRELRVKVEEFCQKHGRIYHSATFWETNIKTLKCLKKTAIEARNGKFVNFKDTMLWEGMCAKG